MTPSTIILLIKTVGFLHFYRLLSKLIYVMNFLSRNLFFYFRIFTWILSVVAKFYDKLLTDFSKNLTQ